MKFPKPRAAIGRAQDVFSIARRDLAAIEDNGALLTTKDLARALRMHIRTVKRWWKVLNVPPFISTNGSHRWTYRQAQTLLKRWQAYAEKSAHVCNWRNGRASAPR